jgi:hypothetical protein
VSDVALAVDRLAPFLRSRLDSAERDEFLDILDQTLAAPGPALGSLDQYRRRLRQKLGFVIK